MKKTYFLSLILFGNLSLNAMEYNQKNTIFSFLPTEMIMKIAAFACDWHKNQKDLTTATQSITSFRLINTPFNALFSDEYVIQMFNMDTIDKKAINQFLFGFINKKSPFFTHLIIKLGADVDRYNSEFKTTPLLQATDNDDYFTCKLLLAEGANIDTSNMSDDFESYDTPLYWPIHISVKNNNNKIVQLFIDAKTKTTGAYMSEPNLLVTPLFMAAKNGNHEMVKLLLPHIKPANVDRKCKAPDIYTNSFCTALDYAHHIGNKEIINLLEEKKRQS